MSFNQRYSHNGIGIFFLPRYALSVEQFPIVDLQGGAEKKTVAAFERQQKPDHLPGHLAVHPTLHLQLHVHVHSVLHAIQ